MAVISNIEWKVQEAVMGALALNADLTAMGVQIRRYGDADNPIDPPAATVFGIQSQHPPEYGGRTAIDETFVEITAQTKVRDDGTGEIAGLILGAIRDQVRDTDFYTQLDAVVGLTVYGTEETGQSLTLDDTSDRIRRLTIRVLANPTDII